MSVKDFSERALKRISPVYEKSLYIREFFKAVGCEFDLIRKLFREFSDGSFIDLVTENFIKYQELKYSLDVREDLDLETRRARLGLKFKTHRPLSPGQMEKYIKESFNADVYLYEKDPGYIRLCVERLTNSEYKSILNWLSVEKPAHLLLSNHWNIVEYLGGVGKAAYKVAPTVEEIELPKTIAEKANFPRVFVGISQMITGSKKVGLAEPKDGEYEIHVGIAHGLSGEVTTAPKQLKHSQLVLRAGVCMQIVGKIWIDSREKPTLPYYPFRLEPPYELDDSHDFYYDMIDKAGIYLAEETPTLRVPLKAQKITVEEGIPDEKLPQMFEWRHITENPYGDLATANFASPRGFATFEPIIFEPDEWDVVKIFFGFATSRHRRYRGIALPNPREDLTKTEIRLAGEYAVENELIMNARGEYANRVLGAALKKREEQIIELEGKS